MIARIRAAVPSEAAALTSIAHASKRHWNYPEAWIAMWRRALTITPEYVAEHELFVIERAGEPLGFYALIPGGESWELDHFWIRPEFAGRGLGRMLFKHVVERVRALAPGACLEIESDPNAEPFYLRMGAERVGTIARDWQGVQRKLPLLRLRPGPPRQGEAL